MIIIYNVPILFTKFKDIHTHKSTQIIVLYSALFFFNDRSRKSMILCRKHISEEISTYIKSNLTVQMDSRVSQLVPKNPSLQLQLYPLRKGSHTPLKPHGFESQKLISEIIQIKTFY